MVRPRRRSSWPQTASGARTLPSAIGPGSTSAPPRPGGRQIEPAVRLSEDFPCAPAEISREPLNWYLAIVANRWSDEIRIVDIALLPAYCNRGLGTTLVRALQAEAAASGKPLRIHVERFNPALRLYERLGFRQIEDKGVYLFLEWTGAVGQSAVRSPSHQSQSAVAGQSAVGVKLSVDPVRLWALGWSVIILSVILWE